MYRLLAVDASLRTVPLACRVGDRFRMYRVRDNVVALEGCNNLSGEGITVSLAQFVLLW